MSKRVKFFAPPIETSNLDQEMLSGAVSYQQSTEGSQVRVDKRELLWEHRGFLFRALVWGFIASTLIAFLIPVQYESTVRLMPPDQTNSSGLAMLSALTAKVGDTPA